MSQYADSGVDIAGKDQGLGGLLELVRGTFHNNPRAPVTTDVGYFAAVIDLKDLPISLAFSTDGVGTKLLVAQMAGKHDTVGIDCIAMNANDLVCVGAEPLALVDYIAVEGLQPEVLRELGVGLAEGARRAEISIPGGEVAQVREMIRGVGDGEGYDLVGSCVGVLEKGRAIDGSSVRPGDCVVGIASTGLHSNGYSLARRAIFDDLGKTVDDVLPECGRTVAEELLEPTAMYVRECKALIRSDVEVKALLNVTGGGFQNLLRVAARDVGFLLDDLPESQPIFQVIQQASSVSDAEMHHVFNMGVGFVVVVPPKDADAVIDVAAREGKTARVIGRVVADPEHRVVVQRPSGLLVSTTDGFEACEVPPAEYRR